MSADLVAFDFDGTLADSEMNVLLGGRADVADRMREITELAMDGDVEYAESLRRRVALLEGLPVAEVDRALDRVELRAGAAELLRALASADVRTVILTGGFDRGVEGALDRAGVTVDRVVANRLAVEDGRLTGEVEGPLVEGTKDDALRAAAEAFGVDLADTLVVGDGANDVPMFEVAGTAVGFGPSAAVRPHADVTVESVPDLRRALERVGVLPPVEGSVGADAPEEGTDPETGTGTETEGVQGRSSPCE